MAVGECAELDDHDLRCYIGKVKTATCKACVGDCACSAWCRREEQRVFLWRSRSVRRKAVGCPFLPVVVALAVNCIRCVWFISPPEKRQALTFVRRRRESSLGVPQRSKAQLSSRSNSSMPTDELKAPCKRKLMSGFAAICLASMTIRHRTGVSSGSGQAWVGCDAMSNDDKHAAHRLDS